MNAGMHEFLAQDRVVWGKPAAEAVPEEAERRGARRVFIVTSRTLNRKTDAVERIRAALGARCVGTFDECVEHTPRPSVIAAAEAARAVDPDLILTFGGGTAIDTVKVMLIALAHGLTRPEQLGGYHLGTNPDGSRRVPQVASPPCRQIVLSTTLSAAEFSNLGGCTDTVRKVKDAYLGREIGAAAVILDPAVTVHTPEWLWLSTAIRAVDHAVEGICSIQPSPLVEATATHALELFARSLARSREAPQDMVARLECLQGAWLSGFGIMRVPYGASHGIGHSLGAVTGMSHGYTSCVMLPHVMRWNAAVTHEVQAQIAAALGRPGVDAPAAVAELIAALGMPTRLRDAGVERAQFAAIAAGALENMWVRSNPRRIDGAADVIALLEAAW
jgi:alcohol dehydrogenase class IV